jgi:protein-tyrosine phosphatase
MPLKQRKTDYHCHILPGLDDGPREQKISVEMARLFAQVGYRKVYCTPHLIKGMYEATTKEVLFERDRLQLELDREGIGIKLLVGREYFLDEFLLDFIKQPLLLEGTNSIMIEISSHTPVDLIKDTLFAVSRSGYTPCIAHPERCWLLEMPEKESDRQGAWKTWFSRSRVDGSESESGNDLLNYLKRLGCQFQANLGSFNGQYGERARTNARYFEKAGTYTHAGTDAHSPGKVKAIFGLQ